MISDVPNNFILNGFDRCGSSAISRVLSQHTKIELIFQPFNSGPIRRIMYQIMGDHNTTVADRRFFEGLENNRLESGYIVSAWHTKHSSVQQMKENRIHLIKTTLNHFTITWIQKNFPDIELWGIWRDPLAILASIERNQFFGKWYVDAIRQITPTVKTVPLLNQLFGRFIEQIDTDIKATAFLIAARTYYYFHFLPAEKVIIYERFKENANTELNRVCQYFDLGEFDFSKHSEKDWNVVGKEYNTDASYGQSVKGADLMFANSVFEPLYDLYKQKIKR